MNNGTLMLNGISYSGNGGTLMLNGIDYTNYATHLLNGVIYNPKYEKEPINVEMVFSGGNGNSNYTITEDGLYLIVVSAGYQGSLNITLPSGRTAMLNTPLIATLRKATFVVAELQEGDVVYTQANYNGPWPNSARVICKLSNVETISVNYSMIKGDSTTSPTMPTDDTHRYIIFGISGGRTSANSVDYTKYNEDTPHFSKKVGNNSTAMCEWGDLELLVKPSMYGYDGGAVSYVIYDCGEK